MTSTVPSSGNENKSTSGESEIEFDDVIGLFIEIEYVGFDVGQSTGFIEVFFDHFEETSSF